MKKSTKVTLTVVAVVGLASCSRRRDPCQAAYFNQQACQEAIDARGYFWHGTWYPMVYSYPYPYYFDSYRTYVSGGGRVYTAPSDAYRHSTITSTGGGSSSHSTSSSPGVSRGGFGSTGASHGSGS